MILSAIGGAGRPKTDKPSAVRADMKNAGKTKNAVSVTVDTYHSRFDFFSVEANDRATVKHITRDYKRPIDSVEFYDELTEAVRSYAEANALLLREATVTLVLPNKLVAMDTVSLPPMSRRHTGEAVDAVLSSQYKNRADLKINHYQAAQTKQSTIFGVCVLRERLINGFSTAMADGGMAPHIITFAANALGAAAMTLNPKLKNSSFLLLDIKHHVSSFAYVSKGHVMGYYDLPFGYSILKKSRVFAEELLFDHDVAELAVLNAREKARAKQLTMMREENLDENAGEEEKTEAMFGADEGATDDPTANLERTAQTIKSLPKKEARKLPKFMQRPLPHTDEEFTLENFRLFEKWALNLLQTNEKFAQIGKAESVLVNLPADLTFFFDKVNEEEKENGIAFKPLEITGNRDGISDYLEEYGALYTYQFSKACLF